MRSKITRLAALLLAGFSLWATNDSMAQKAEDITAKEGKLTSNGAWIPDKVEEMEDLKLGPFVRLDDGSILTVEANKSSISTDSGKTWTEHPIFDEPDKYAVRPERALIRTRSGVVILAFANDQERANWNWQEDIHDSPGATLPTYTIRSLDGGKTWQDLQKDPLGDSVAG